MKSSKKPVGLFGKTSNFDNFLEKNLLEFTANNQFAEYMNDYSIDLKNFLTFEAGNVDKSTKKLKSFLFCVSKANEKVKIYRNELGIICDKLVFSIHE